MLARRSITTDANSAMNQSKLETNTSDSEDSGNEKDRRKRKRKYNSVRLSNKRVAFLRALFSCLLVIVFTLSHYSRREQTLNILSKEQGATSVYEAKCLA